MKTVNCRVAIEDVNLEALTWARIDKCTRNAPAEHWLVDVCRHELVWLGNQITRVEILPIDECVQPACLHLRGRYDGVLMPWIAHAIPAVDMGWHDLELRLNGAVVEDL